MPGEYIVPLGIDGDKVTAGLFEVEKSVDKFETKVTETGRSIEEAFGKGAKAADAMDDSLKPTTKSLEQIRSASKQTGEELAKALNIRDAGKGFADQITNVKNQLKTLTEKNKIGIEVDKQAVKDLEAAAKYLKDNYDEVANTLNETAGLLDGKIASAKEGIADMEQYVKDLSAALEATAPGAAALDMQAELAATNEALREEIAALADYEAQLKQTNDANSNLTRTLTDANAAVALLTTNEINLNSTFEEVYGTVQPLTTRLGELEDRMYELALAGQQNTAEFRELQDEAIRYRQTIQQVDAAVDTFAKNSAVLDIAVEAATGLTGAFAAVQGAAALFGDESEALQEALLRVNAAMSVLQGVQAVAAVLNKESAIAALFFRNSTAAATVATEAQTAATAGQTVVTTGATLATRALGVALKGLGIGLIISLIVLLVEYWDDLTESVNKLLPAGESVGKMFDKIKSIATGVGNVVFQYLITPFTALTKLLNGDLEGFKNAIVDGFSFKKNFTDGFNRSELSNAKKHARELEEVQIAADQRDLDRRKNRGEDVSRQEIALQKRRVALNADSAKKQQEEQVKLEDLQDKNFKALSDKQKQAAEDAKKAREDAAKKRLEEEQKNAAYVEKFAREAADIRIRAIKNDLERERATIIEDYRRKQEDLAKENATTAEAINKQGQLMAALISERDAKIKDLELTNAKEKQKFQLDAQKALQDLAREGTERDLKLLQIDHDERKAEIEEQYKNETDLRVKLLSALEDSTAREQSRIKNEAAQKNLEDEEIRQLAAIELTSKYAIKNEETERQKQIAIYETKIEFAEKAVALAALTNGSNSAEVAQARVALKNLRDGLQKELETGSKKPFSFMEFIGLGDLTDDQSAAVQKAGQQAAEALGQITDFIVDQYQRQIDKKQESIDQLDNEIGDLESKLDEEKELRENGFANNVELIEAELAEKQRQKDEEVRQQEELMKKKQAMQKAQMAVDTAVQLVNMITASTEIFKSLAGIPFIGVPLAIAAIGTMFGAFVVAKVKAFQNISSQSFGDGGWIDGKSHAEGGKKYYSAEGDVRELEKDEFVVKRKQAKKYANILEAINNNAFSGFDIHDAGLKDMLNAMGIDLSEDSSREGLDEANRLSDYKINITVTNKSNDREMREMNDNIRFLADQKRSEITTWEDDKYFYSKMGNRTTKIAKNPKKLEVTNES